MSFPKKKTTVKGSQKKVIKTAKKWTKEWFNSEEEQDEIFDKLENFLDDDEMDDFLFKLPPKKKKKSKKKAA
jgi:hypothetical protein